MACLISIYMYIMLCQKQSQQSKSYGFIADTWSLFQTGWFDLPEKWNDPSILDNIQPVLDIREHLSDLLVSEPSMEFDVMIYASSLLYSKLQVKTLVY